MRGRHLGYAGLMTVHAFDPMNIVRAGCVDECRIHLLHIKAAVRHLRATGLAGCASVSIVPVVARDAADPLMDTHWCAIVA
jgi:hypothetical protein